LGIGAIETCSRAPSRRCSGVDLPSLGDTLSCMKIEENGMSGLLRGGEIVVSSGARLSITVLDVAAARKAWAAVQPLLVGIMTAAEVGDLSGLAVASHMGRVSADCLDELSKLFAAKTQTSEGKSLAERGVMEAVFAGEFDSMIEWIDAAIALNFGRQIEKTSAALQARSAAVPPPAAG